ncbi:MAG TPA: serine/threonine protein kinase [Steroidobacteraceae bacterium]
MTHSAPAPFDALDPDAVFAAAESIGLVPSGRLFALNSYENRVYQLGDEQGDLWVLKFYRPARWSDAAIAEEHAFTLELAAAELPVAAPLTRDGRSLFVHRSQRFAAFPYLAGRAPELDDFATLALLGRTLARIHAIGARQRFAHRPVMSLARLGEGARAQVLDSGFVPEALGEQYARVSEQVIGRVRQSFDNFGPLPQLRIHGDCHVGNILWRESGPLFVDLDDCMSGPRIQDLWMFLSGDAVSQQASWAALMEGYEVFGEFDSAELTLVEALRSLRILHHAAWIANRWADPAFPRAFPWFGDARFWERHISDLFEQLAAMDDPPILSR